MKTFFTGRIGHADGIQIVAKAKHVLSPSWIFVQEFKAGKISWNEYRSRYLALMRSRWLEDRSRFDFADGSVFLCYCADFDKCHRSIVAEMLMKMGWAYGGEK